MNHWNVLKDIPEPLLSWYAEHARVLPWRSSKGPYGGWISEVMLQQTRVETVIPYYLRFLQRFPNITSLAEADEAVLLKLWEGLGYYSRARNLKKAAQKIRDDFNGVFPSQYDALCKLPGVGEYIAGAVASIAFECPEPAIDGNVLRVAARLCDCREDVTKAAVKRELREALKKIYPKGHCGDFTQSLMELGAIVCIPNGMPYCDICPLNKYCLAQKNGTVMQLPQKPAKKSRRLEQRCVFLLYFNGKVALRQRSEKGLLAGMWEFPNVMGDIDDPSVCDFLNAVGICRDRLKFIGKTGHVFSHVEWTMSGYEAECPAAYEDLKYVSLDEMNAFAIPSAFRFFEKYCRQSGKIK